MEHDFESTLHWHHPNKRKPKKGQRVIALVRTDHPERDPHPLRVDTLYYLWPGDRDQEWGHTHAVALDRRESVELWAPLSIVIGPKGAG